jgi:hypothetical protein
VCALGFIFQAYTLFLWGKLTICWFRKCFMLENILNLALKVEQMLAGLDACVCKTNLLLLYIYREVIGVWLFV